VTNEALQQMPRDANKPKQQPKQGSFYRLEDMNTNIYYDTIEGLNSEAYPNLPNAKHEMQ